MSKKNVDSGYWKVTIFNTDVPHNLSYDPGHIEFTHDQFPHVVRKQNTWLKGEGAYARDDFVAPKVLDVWNMMYGKFPCKSFIFERWVIQKEYECFKYKLMGYDNEEIKVIHENMIGDDLALKTHFIEFLYMLRKIKSDLTEDKTIKLIDYKRGKEEQIKRMMDNLDSVLGS
jgi:hypothetical protein